MGIEMIDVFYNKFRSIEQIDRELPSNFSALPRQRDPSNVGVAGEARGAANEAAKNIFRAQEEIDGLMNEFTAASKSYQKLSKTYAGQFQSSAEEGYRLAMGVDVLVPKIIGNHKKEISKLVVDISRLQTTIGERLDLLASMPRPKYAKLTPDFAEPVGGLRGQLPTIVLPN
jgi:hypothetical protein